MATDLAADRADLIFTALRLRHMLDISDVEDVELLTAAITQFCGAADRYERHADELLRQTLERGTP